jgi:predicted AAA+ superfamily ATPase
MSDLLICNAVEFIGDDLYTQALLARHELEDLKRIVGGATTIFIDEAQRIENIGLTLKLLMDHLPVTVIASGSASFELADRLSEPLTGRARCFHLHPLLGGGSRKIQNDRSGNGHGRHTPLRNVSPRALSGK